MNILKINKLEMDDKPIVRIMYINGNHFNLLIEKDSNNL